MKNLIVLVAITVLFAFFFANNLSAQWSINGNSGTNPPINFLGTTDNKSLVFKTNGNERMRVSNTGKVGIGVTSPSYKLDVAGDINIGSSNSFRIGGTSILKESSSVGNFLIGESTASISSGTGNTCVGNSSFHLNTTGYNNTAVGNGALNSNNIGFENTAIGFTSLSLNTGGYYNVAIGSGALYNNGTGYYNTANGEIALWNNLSGAGNTAIGGFALGSNTTGNDNTCVGMYTDVNSGNLTNATALGFNSIATASNQVMLGNTSVTSVMAAGSFVIYSDGRFKKNVKEDVPGLAFIRQLRPVTYNYDIRGLNSHLRSSSATDQKNPSLARKMEPDEAAIDAKEKIIYTGFIAQEVDDAAKKIGYDFSGVYHPADDYDAYGLSYADFVVPLVKAVQELSTSNDELKTSNEELKKEVEDLKSSIANPYKNIGTAQQTSTSDGFAELKTLNTKPETILGQNIPNPFDNSTLIPFRIPKDCKDASIMIANTSTSEVISVIPISCNEDHVSIDAGILASGSYAYTLYVDGKMIDSKRMLLTK